MNIPMENAPEKKVASDQLGTKSNLQPVPDWDSDVAMVQVRDCKIL